MTRVSVLGVVSLTSALAALGGCGPLATGSYPGEPLFSLRGTAVDEAGVAVELLQAPVELRARLWWHDVTTADRRRVAEAFPDFSMDDTTVFRFPIFGPPYVDVDISYGERRAPDGAIGVVITMAGDTLNEEVTGVDDRLIVTFNGPGGALDDVGYPRGLAVVRLDDSGAAVVDAAVEAARVVQDGGDGGDVAQVLEAALGASVGGDGG